MDQAMAFIHQKVSPADLIFVDAATRLQLGHYLCRQEQISVDRSLTGFESFECHGFRVISTGQNDGVLTAGTFAKQWQTMAQVYSLLPGVKVWVFQGGWAAGLGESLRERSPEFSGLQPHSFGRYLEIFELKVGPPVGRAGQG
jgi:hypothetical protein